METNINELLGKTLKSINKIGDSELIFITTDNIKYKMYHNQDCCEYVWIDDIDGDLDDLIDNEILQAEEISNYVLTEEQKKQEEDENVESCTWTFYKLATFKGYVTIKWFGKSNGYYSERVDFEKIDTK